MDEVIDEFLKESREHLDELDNLIIDLEDEASDDTMQAIFRKFHTIKGSCGYLGFERTETLTHRAETLLSCLQEAPKKVEPVIIDTLLNVLDATRTQLDHIESEHEELDRDFETLVNLLEGFADVIEKDGDLSAVVRAATGGTDATSDDEEHDEEPKSSEPDEESGASVGASTEASSSSLSMDQQNVRVDVELLDQLMNEVGELVLARNQLLQEDGETRRDGENNPREQIDRITTQLQESVMETRMQPIKRLWNKYPRIVRDLARDTGKKVELEMEGEETELDKNLIESIADPMTHLIRNAVDHGIEPPVERREAGKSETGTVTLAALHEGGQIQIEIRDDGGGMKREDIVDKAVSEDIISPSDSERLTDEEVYQLIFEPGFSTNEEVTSVSGRGVGMDVVKKNIESIGGDIDIRSVPGEGSQFKLSIPLTLAIVPALIVEAGAHEFAIPQMNLMELLRIESGESIDSIRGTPVYRFRDELLPLVDLGNQLDLSNGREEMTSLDETVKVAVVFTDQTKFGLIVDKIHDTEEIVVKPLCSELKKLDVYAGATIKGDGTVILILDVPALASKADVLNDEDRRDLLNAGDEQDSSETEQISSVLVCRTSDDGRLGIELDQVERLEHIQRDRLESLSAGDRVIQYRDTILPLIDVENCLPERRDNPRNPDIYEWAQNKPTLPVALCSYREQQIGLIVPSIIDITETSLSDRRPATRPGVEYCTVIDDRITEMLELESLVEAADISLVEG